MTLRIHKHGSIYRVTQRKRLDPPNASGREWVMVTLALFSGPDAEQDAREYVEGKKE